MLTVRCLFFQACVFNFGNEFCRKDPFPGARKNLNINVTCIRDDLMPQSHADHVPKRDVVLNILYDSKLDEGIEDFEAINLTDRWVEETVVFNAGCTLDPYTAGYRNECPIDRPYYKYRHLIVLFFMNTKKIHGLLLSELNNC
jgi:hypothetical protein